MAERRVNRELPRVESVPGQLELPYSGCACEHPALIPSPECPVEAHRKNAARAVR